MGDSGDSLRLDGGRGEGENVRPMGSARLEWDQAGVGGVDSAAGGDAALGGKMEGVEHADWNAQNAALGGLDTAVANTHLSSSSQQQHRNARVASPGLRIETHAASPPPPPPHSIESSSNAPPIVETSASNTTAAQPSLMSPGIPPTTSSLRSNLSTSSIGSTISQGSASALTSPYLSAMTDLTPLPSPRSSTDLSGGSTWRRSMGRSSALRSREGSMDEPESSAEYQSPVTSSPLAATSARKRKGYGSLLQDAVLAAAAVEDTSTSKGNEDGQQQHGRNRSVSDFVPEQLQNHKQRVVTFGPGDQANLEGKDARLHREEHFAGKRGIGTSSSAPVDVGGTHANASASALPTPPASNSTSSIGESDGGEEDDEKTAPEDGSQVEYLEIHCGQHNKRRKFRQLRQLGEGTFSRVMLATPAHHKQPVDETHLDPSQLVAVKIVEHGPAGGADESRIATSLRREVSMLQSLSNPSLIHLKACEYQASRALLLLPYCPGGDLFELASTQRDVLTPQLTQRIFAELVGAVRYLHVEGIVHRDIKLENVLVNLPPPALRSLLSTDPRRHPQPIVTLTDLGLSRRVPQPPESPLLTTRCGSEDYAAPEILLGQPYDGRATDAWALGVLLYALMEGRLPFDAPPNGKPERGRASHRIARCEWIWWRFGDPEGDWDGTGAGRAGSGWEGSREVVEGLLKKVRMGRVGLEKAAEMGWVREGVVVVEGGLRVGAGGDL